MIRKGIIGLISAVPTEGKGLFSRPAGPDPQKYPPTMYKCTASGRHVVHAVSGLGKVNAAHAATVLIKSHAPSLIINFGVGGAYPSSGLKIGDIAVATSEIYADEGVLAKDGLKTLDLIGIPLVRAGRKKYFNEFPVGGTNLRKIIDGMAASEQALSGEFKIGKGAFATVSACTGTTKRALELERRFGVICENMEGAAVAQICIMYQTPMIEIRGISNLVTDRDRKSWDLGLASKNCRTVLKELLMALGGAKD
jgi:futalosine hydrolase